jgi:uncharacterized coiled-coil DUF342 family protein
MSNYIVLIGTIITSIFALLTIFANARVAKPLTDAEKETKWRASLMVELENNRTELKEQRTLMKENNTKLDVLRAEVDIWKQKYFDFQGKYNELQVVSDAKYNELRSISDTKYNELQAKYSDLQLRYADMERDIEILRETIKKNGKQTR